MEYYRTYFVNSINNMTQDYSKESMSYLTTRERSIFFSVFLLLYLAALLGNVLAIITTCRRKHRYIQKTLIISLAFSDLLMATAYAVNYLEVFSHPLLNWTMGEIMCFLLPYFQIFGAITSSGAMVAIAVDRYRTAVHATMKRWNPRIWLCLLGIFLLWCISGGLAFPIWTLLEHKNIRIVYKDDDGNTQYEDAHICTSAAQEDMMIYYICIGVIVFAPLLILVSWLYYNIFKLVCKHRKTSTAQHQAKRATSRTSITQADFEEDAPGGIIRNQNASALPQRKSIHVQRKIRVFKIMIFLMLAFFICRIPQWVFHVMMLDDIYTEKHHWILTCTFNALALLNSVMNPFLYAFLPQTMAKVSKIWKTLCDFTCEVCCCCCSNSEFEQFERENPFCVENYDGGYRHPTSKNSGKSQRVKFADGKENKY